MSLALIFVIFLIPFTPSLASQTFKAAVLEHVIVFPPDEIFTRSEALQFMEPNLIQYERQAAIAKRQKVDILVTPEDGIHSVHAKRDVIAPYLETIPDPKVTTWTPCDEGLDTPNIQVQRRLSCIAKNNNLYFIANFGDTQNCSKQSDPKCPSDGRYQFNTNLVFAPNGTLIAKYHKKHLFYEAQFDEPEVAENIVFDTPFGRFSVFTCFDILFKKPAISVIEDLGVGNIAFLTAWMDVLPLLAAIQFHSSFAVGMGVNVLASNVHYLPKRAHGSGIYTPRGPAAYYYNDTEGNGGEKLLIANVESIDTPGFLNRKFSLNEISEVNTVDEYEFQSVLFGDIFNFIRLKHQLANLKVCHGTLCCYANYTASFDSSDRYVLGAFDGLHTNEGQYYLQICTLLKCNDSTQSSCGSPTTIAHSTFSKISIKGDFRTRYIFPEVLMSDSGSLKLAEPHQQTFDGQILTATANYPLLSATLFGRRYDWDGGRPVHHTSSGRMNSYVMLYVIILIITSLVHG